MNALANYLQSNSLTGTPAEIVAALDAEVVLSRDSQRWTYAGLARRFGPTIVGQVDEGLKATPGMDWVRLALAAGGLDFSDAVTQAGLDSLKGVFPDEMIAGLKAVGVVTGKRYTQAGFDALPTEEQVAAAQSQIAVAKWVAAVQNEVIGPMAAGGESSIADIKAAVAAFEG
jgi:hypothetical protein